MKERELEDYKETLKSECKYTSFLHTIAMLDTLEARDRPGEYLVSSGLELYNIHEHKLPGVLHRMFTYEGLYDWDDEAIKKGLERRDKLNEEYMLYLVDLLGRMKVCGEVENELGEVAYILRYYLATWEEVNYDKEIVDEYYKQLECVGISREYLDSKSREYAEARLQSKKLLEEETKGERNNGSDLMEGLHKQNKLYLLYNTLEELGYKFTGSDKEYIKRCNLGGNLLRVYVDRETGEVKKKRLELKVEID